MTTPAIEISIKIHEMPPRVAKALGDLSEAVTQSLASAERAAEAEQAVVSGPTVEEIGSAVAAMAAMGAMVGAERNDPAEAETALPQAAEPAKPYAAIIEALTADLATADVTKLLILPLLQRWPDIRGEPRHVLGKAANQFRYYSKRELEFARNLLLKGKHEYFPDGQEIYGALGRFKGYKARKEEAQQKELTADGGRTL